MAKLFILIGFPGSGKSTWAKEYVALHESTVIINGDSIRSMLFGSYRYDPNIEPTVKSMIAYSVTSMLHQGYSVIVDETNITKEKRKTWLDIATEPSLVAANSIEVEFLWFTESNENLNNRMNDSRGYSREKWTEVIEGMKKKFEAPERSELSDCGLCANLKKISLKKENEPWVGVDLDGTLAYYDGWKGEEVIGDPIPLMMKLVRMMIQTGTRVKIMTARAGTQCGRNAVARWLNDNRLYGIEVTNKKDFQMTALYDDRAFQVERNTGIVKGSLT